MRVCLGSSRIALLSNKRGLRRKRRADVPNAGAKGTRMERSYIGSILCLPTASALPNWLERRLRYVSVLWAALRQATACLQDTYGASEANRKPHAGCADRAASVTRAAEGRAKGSCVGPGSTESGEIPYYYLALPSYP